MPADGSPPTVLVTTARRGLTATVIGLMALAGCHDSRPPERPAIELDHAGQRIEGSIAPGTTDRYSVELEAGWAFRLEVDQAQVDVMVRWIAADGSTQEVDSPTDRDLAEAACFVASTAGRHHIEITPFTRGGAYALEVGAKRPATARDRLCADAQSQFLAIYRPAHTLGDTIDPRQLAALDTITQQFDRAEETVRAAVVARLAGTLLANAGRPTEATSRLESALRLARAGESPPLVHSALNRLAAARRHVEDLEGARTLYLEALRLAVDRGDRRAEATALTNLGSLGPDLGDPHGALDPLDRAATLWRELGLEPQLAQTWIHRGVALGALDRQADAEDAIDQALTLAEALDDASLQARALDARGWSLYLAGEFDAALDQLNRAADLVPASTATAATARIDRLATVRAAAGDIDGAIRLRRDLITRIDAEANPRDHAGALLNLGCLLAEQAEPEEAEASIRHAAAFFASSADLTTRAHLASCQARLAAGQGDRIGAIEHADRSLALLDQLRAQARAEGQHRRPLRVWRDYADLAIDLRLDLAASQGEDRLVATAFETYDRARAWSLFEQVLQRRKAAEAQVDAEAEALRERLRQLAGQRQPRAQTATASPAPEARLDAELRRVALDLERARGARQAQARAAGDISWPQAVSIHEVQALLPDGAMLLAYRLGRDRSDVFCLRKDRIEVRPLADASILEAHAEAFHRSLVRSRSDPHQWRLIGHRLSDLLLPRAAIADDIDRLFVIADGSLHYVPFGALLSPRGLRTTEAEPPLLIDHFEMSYLPSASVFAALDARREARPPGNRMVAAFVDPVFGPDDPRLRQARGAAPEEPANRDPGHLRLPDGPLPRLPHTADEAAQLIRLVAADQRTVYAGFEATKAAVLDGSLAAYRALHFATHALIDDAVPELSGLVMSRFDASGQAIDGNLYLHEIQDLELAADLTVLSGCQTALGQHVRGNGLLGLTHGFFDAGSTRVLVTLWSVDDLAASLLMRDFYQRWLGTGETPAEALRGAQVALRGTAGYEAPYFWAQFALHGAP